MRGSSMRVGSLVFATEQGIGILAKDFHDHGVVTDVMVVRHGRRPEQPWYPKAPVLHTLRKEVEHRRMRDFCGDMDVMLFFETPFHWDLIPFCKDIGVPTVLMTMYECMPEALPVQPDVFLCPSLLDLEYYVDGKIGSTGDLRPFMKCDAPGGRAAYFTPVPVQVPWRRRTRAHTFVHNAGWGGLKGRNGTAELLEAMEHIKSPARMVIRSQEPLSRTANYRQASQLTNPLVRRGQSWSDDPEQPPPEWMVTYQEGTIPREDLYDIGDVFIFPEKFNGLSLPLQEACAAGMLVMGTDRFPMNTWLPTKPLIPIRSTRRSRVSPRCNEFDEAVIEPVDIARKIDEWFDNEITEYSDRGREWSQENSWQRLKPAYLKLLEGLL